ncbi:hypothetical protein AC1031_008048 [Aphanomyces cochlioides]|nr:hypothetical protein AC1031_008048 [Aphanomyces cochlioides]
MLRLWVLSCFVFLAMADECQWKASETLTTMKNFSCTNPTSVLKRLDINLPMAHSPLGDEFRVYVLDTDNRARFDIGEPYACLNENCEEALSTFDSIVSVSSDISISIECMEVPCDVSWNWQLGRVSQELSNNHRRLGASNACLGYPGQYLRPWDDNQAYICSAKAGSIFGPYDNQYPMVWPENGFKYKVYLFDWTNYQKFKSGSTYQCLNGDSCATVFEGTKSSPKYNTSVTLNISQTYVAVVQCKIIGSGDCFMNLNFQFVDPSGYMDTHEPSYSEDVYPQPWEFLNACSSPNATVVTTLQNQVLAFICTTQAGTTFGKKVAAQAMVSSNQNDTFQIYLLNWTNYR